MQIQLPYGLSDKEKENFRKALEKQAKKNYDKEVKDNENLFIKPKY